MGHLAFGFVSQGNTNVGKLATLTMYHSNIYKGKFDVSPKLNNFMTQKYKMILVKWSNKSQSSKGTKLKGQSILKPFQLPYTRMQKSVLPVWSRGSACAVQEQLSNKHYHFSLGYILVFTDAVITLSFLFKKWKSSSKKDDKPMKTMVENTTWSHWGQHLDQRKIWRFEIFSMKFGEAQNNPYDAMHQNQTSYPIRFCWLATKITMPSILCAYLVPMPLQKSRNNHFPINACHICLHLLQNPVKASYFRSRPETPPSAP